MILKRILILPICILSILLVLLNINPIASGISNLLSHPTNSKMESKNEYYKNYNYKFVSNTKNFIPYGKQDLLNIVYTAINSGVTNFTFYCSKVYQNCLEDINNFSNDANMLTHLNNFVHPFNSFKNIRTIISDSGEVTLEIDYLYSKDEIKAINDEINKLLPELLKEAEKLNENETDPKNSEYNKIKVIHDYIINNTKYDLTDNKENKSFNAYGALFNHLATCNGYTDLMAIFLTKMGYNNYKIATTEGTEENAEGHVWNAVNINNEWLHLDLTWDDPVSSDGKDYLYHKYFLITTEELKTADSNITSKEHEFDTSIYLELNK